MDLSKPNPNPPKNKRNQYKPAMNKSYRLQVPPTINSSNFIEDKTNDQRDVDERIEEDKFKLMLDNATKGVKEQQFRYKRLQTSIRNKGKPMDTLKRSVHNLSKEVDELIFLTSNNLDTDDIQCKLTEMYNQIKLS